MRECQNYKKIGSEKLECQACAHFCKIAPGNTGICGVRQNRKGKLYSLVYEQAIALNVDPIEKKPFFHFFPGSYAYSVGTLGCNFRCANCQNYEISQIGGLKGKIKEYEKINWGQEISPEQIVKNALDLKCQSIAYTYNEPTVFREYALDTMKIAHKKGLKNVWVSNGFMSAQTRKDVIPYLDAINIDLKSFRKDFYGKYCGASLPPVLQNCQKFKEEGVWLEITTLIIPTLSDDPQMLREIINFIKEKLGKETPWHISAFSGRFSWKLEHLPDTQPEKILKIKNMAKKEGLKNVYPGNI